MFKIMTKVDTDKLDQILDMTAYLKTILGYVEKTPDKKVRKKIQNLLNDFNKQGEILEKEYIKEQIIFESETKKHLYV